MDPTRRLPPELLDDLHAFARGEREPVTPRNAATVVLLRPASAGGVEVYLLRRHRGMSFAGGMYVFPGGGVDARDEDSEIAWAGHAPEFWAERLTCTESLARALVCAAVRETFEESGVLLAGPTPDTVVADTTGEDWEADRQALVDRELSFAEFLHRRDLVLRADLLAAWAHWITPEFEPRRFDTRFFVAALPPGQVTRDVSTESDRVGWLRPAQAIGSVEEGSMRMLPPTYVTLHEMSALARPEDALSAADERTISPIQPSVRFDEAGAFLAVEGTDG